MNLMILVALELALAALPALASVKMSNTCNDEEKKRKKKHELDEEKKKKKKNIMIAFISSYNIKYSPVPCFCWCPGRGEGGPARVTRW